MELNITDLWTGTSITTQVDGPNVPPFLHGLGRFDTGDVPSFNTGDRIVIAIASPLYAGSENAKLRGGTTWVNISLEPTGEGPSEPEEMLSELERENAVLWAENEELKRRISVLVGEWPDPSLVLASMDSSNLTFGSLDWVPSIFNLVADRTYWILDYSLSQLGRNMGMVINGSSRAATNVWNMSMEGLETAADQIPNALNAKLLAVISVVIIAGGSAAILIRWRSSGNFEPEDMGGPEEEGPPFWDGMT